MNSSPEGQIEKDPEREELAQRDYLLVRAADDTREVFVYRLNCSLLFTIISTCGPRLDLLVFG